MTNSAPSNAPQSVPAAGSVCGCCGFPLFTRALQKRGYCFKSKCEKVRKGQRWKTRKPSAPKAPVASEDELSEAYKAGYKNGLLPETMGPEQNPHAWKQDKKSHILAFEWVNGWTDGAEAFCLARDNQRNAEASHGEG